MSECWEALLLFNLWISFWISSFSSSLKQKASPPLNLFWIAIMLGWFLYSKFALRVWSSILSMKDSFLKYFEILKLLTILEKNLFRTSAVSNSV